MKTKDKQMLIDQLKKTPIVQVSCERLGIGRATYYRWRKEDKEFAANSEKALVEGRLLVNDLAESQLMSAIKEKNMTAIIFWLKHHHPSYTTKVEVMTSPKQFEDNLTPEQESLIRKALEMVALVPAEKHE